MSDKNTGGSAFPQEVRYIAPNGETGSHGPCGGMTLRDYFAVHATDEDLKAQAEIIRAKRIHSGLVGILPDDWRTSARYMHADAMLEARKS